MKKALYSPPVNDQDIVNSVQRSLFRISISLLWMIFAVFGVVIAIINISNPGDNTEIFQIVMGILGVAFVLESLAVFYSNKYSIILPVVIICMLIISFAIDIIENKVVIEDLMIESCILLFCVSTIYLAKGMWARSGDVDS